MSVLSRRLEPEVMDSAEDARDYDAMDHSAVNRAFTQDFLALWDGNGPILDVGTGTAQIPIVLCLEHPTAQVVAIDAAGHMLELAASNVARAGLTGRLRLERCDAKKLPQGAGSMGAVISNSILHHIPDPGTVVAEMVRVLAPGGWLFVRDLLRPLDQDTLDLLVEQHARGANAHQRQLFADSLHASLSLAEIRLLVAGMGIDPASVQQTSDRHWTWAVRKPGKHHP